MSVRNIGRMLTTSDEMGAVHVARSIATLSIFDAFIATTVSCIRENGCDKIGSHRQKL